MIRLFGVIYMLIGVAAFIEVLNTPGTQFFSASASGVLAGYFLSKVIFNEP
jgi:hypothetical protein